MLCDNCKKREANVMYSENINGAKKELHLCEECSEKLGIGKMDFDISKDLSNLFGNFMEGFATPEFMPLFEHMKDIQCEQCGFTFDDIVETGKLGCGKCYETFEEKLEPILKRIQGNTRHIGRIGKISSNEIKGSVDKNQKEETKNDNENQKSEVESLQEQLKQAIKEERYEDAAKIRDEIKKRENK